MTQQTPHLLQPGACLLGENPAWHPDSQRLFWLDTLAGQVHVQPPPQRLWSTERLLGGLVRHPGGWLLGADQQLLFLSDQGEVQPVLDLPLTADEHVNDAIADLYGRLWLCTKHQDCHPGYGKLLRIDNRGCQILLEGFTVPNGLGFSADNRRLYLVESSRREVRHYEFNVLSGTLGNGQRLIDFADQPGFPDGLALDQQDRLWIAHWAGSRVSCWSASGQLQQTLELPVSKVTSLCFAGPDLRQLCITSARKDLSEPELQREPLAGSLFEWTAPVAGLTRYQAKLSILSTL